LTNALQSPQAYTSRTSKELTETKALPYCQAQDASGPAVTAGSDPAEMVQKIQAFARLGVDRVVIAPSTGERQEMTQALEVMAQDVMPSCV
jgi:hypothetical protein